MWKSFEFFGGWENFMCGGVLPTCMSMYFAWYPWMPEEGRKSPRPAVIDCC